MRILLTGVTGMLGAQVFQQMRAKGWDVVPVVRRAMGLENEVTAQSVIASEARQSSIEYALSTKQNANTGLPRFARNDEALTMTTKQERSELLQNALIVDFSSEEDFNEISKIPPCQAIVHLASHIDFSQQAKESDFYPATIHATNALIDIAKKWNAHFVFSSTISVYAENSLIQLESEVKPASVYAKTKWQAENLITNQLTEFTILRYVGLMGLTQDFHLGVNRFLMSALQENLPPTVHGSGESKRNYLYIKDAALAILHAIEHKIYGTFLAAGSEVLSIKQMAEKICESYLPGQQPLYVSPTDRHCERSAAIQSASNTHCGPSRAQALDCRASLAMTRSKEGAAPIQHTVVTAAKQASTDFIVERSNLFPIKFNFEEMLNDIRSDYEVTA